MKALFYTTKQPPYLVKRHILTDMPPVYLTVKENVEDKLNGKIVAECDFEVEKINVIDGAFTTHTLNEKELLNKSCLTFHQMFDYFANTFNYGYAIHIKNLKIFDIPRDLDDYFTRPKKMNTLNGYSYVSSSIDKAPQNMMYCVDENENEYILISVRSNWMCKIANKEKTIEVRKSVLKEMLKCLNIKKLI